MPRIPVPAIRQAAAWEAARRIPCGQVRTYGEVAEMAGGSRFQHARAVGQAMRRCPSDVPWWRVVAAGGRLIIPGGTAEQARRLAAEGVEVIGKRVTGIR